jgi:uncharacterized membrane protein
VIYDIDRKKKGEKNPYLLSRQTYKNERMLMMKKIAVVASTVMAVGLLAASGVTAFAANTNTTSTLKTNVSAVTTSLEKTKLSFEEIESQMKEKLAQFLADGKITQEQYDQAMSDIAEGKMPEMFDRGRGGYGENDSTELTEEQKAEMQSKMKERFAQLLADGKITQEQYDQAMSDIAEGKTPEMPGRDRDESGEKNRPEMTEEQKAEMQSKMKEKLAQLLADGNITQEQYDQALNDIAEGKNPEISGIGRGGFHGNKTEDTTEI